MAEWFKAHAWKACKGETLSWVRIPLSPPTLYLKFYKYKKKQLKIHQILKYKKIVFFGFRNIDFQYLFKQ